MDQMRSKLIICWATMTLTIKVNKHFENCLFCVRIHDHLTLSRVLIQLIKHNLD